MQYEKFSEKINTETYVEKSIEKKVSDGGETIILIGPSGCGKSAIGTSLSSILSSQNVLHLSMGDILRSTIENTKSNSYFREFELEKFGISNKVCIYDLKNNKECVVKKAIIHKEDIIKQLKIEKGFISQLDWLEFCVKNGYLVPDDWTIKLMDAYLGQLTKNNKGIIILDGYPRTTLAAQNLLLTLNKLNITIIKVIHLFITKEQMNIRLQNRGREDDTKGSVERRYEFYVDKVQPTIDYFKKILGNSLVSIVDAHQPITNNEGNIDVRASIEQVVKCIIDVLNK